MSQYNFLIFRNSSAGTYKVTTTGELHIMSLNPIEKTVQMCTMNQIVEMRIVGPIER